MADIISIHNSSCPKPAHGELQLSSDGVHENKSSAVSIDVFSVCFKNCKNIYPHKLVRPLGSYKVDTRRHNSDVINDILLNDYQISQFIGDKLKRSDIKDCKGHSSWFPCEYCYAKGIKIDLSEKNSKAIKKINEHILLISEKVTELRRLPTNSDRTCQIDNLLSLKNDLQKSLNSLKRKSNILWPSSTLNAMHRSRNSVMEIVNRIENNETLSIDEAKGIKGRSLLLDIPNFDFTYDAPAEYLHSGCLGVIKGLVQLTFNVGQKRQRITKRKLSSTEDFNKLMLATKVVKEFGRRARSLDFSVFKAEEYRNICIFFFLWCCPVLKMVKRKEIYGCT